jgi:riboflavin kinase/FMN adenylyltransferase
MKFIANNPSGDSNYAIALGNFDGIHLGHRCVIETAKIKAKHLGCKSAVFTFWPHPTKILKGNNINEILTLERKIEMMKAIGIDDVFVIDFSLDFSMTTAEDFINQLCQRFNIKSITTGYNFRFGHNRHGNIETLHRMRDHYGFEYNAIKQILVDGCTVSSSVLRKVIQMGCMKVFKDFTGRKYSMEFKMEGEIELLGYRAFKGKIINTSVLTPPFGAYFSVFNQNYYTTFLTENNEILLMLQDKPAAALMQTTNTIELIQLIKQYKILDKSNQSKLLIDSCLKGTEFCLKYKR